MLSLLYDTGVRVQELVDLRMEDVRLSSPTVIRLTEKGKQSPVGTHPTEVYARADKHFKRKLWGRRIPVQRLFRRRQPGKRDDELRKISYSEYCIM